MLRKLRSHARQNVVGYVALFFALGGSAYAAVVVSSNDQIGPDTIYGANKPTGANDNIVANSVAGTDLAFNSVGTGKVIDNSLGAIDLGPNSVATSEAKDNSLTGADIAEGSLETVPAAYEADHAILSDSAHSAGHAPVEGYVPLSENASSGNQVAGTLDKVVDCPAGERPLGGGGSGYNTSFTTGDNVAIINSEPAVYIHPQTGVVYPYGWYVKVKNNTPNTGLGVRAWVVCANTDLTGP